MGYLKYMNDDGGIEIYPFLMDEGFVSTSSKEYYLVRKLDSGYLIFIIEQNVLNGYLYDSGGKQIYAANISYKQGNFIERYSFLAIYASRFLSGTKEV
ncbi:hypothetical protein DFO73_110207 [Cytobacillus oceanisediminis]|uniref:Uncharacterized protein n=1 Tax=Cytobacillus oceanisediminis TaxID=665099 RepID=A0A2V2ZVX8_9BACI|nr:hypothetical protein [Cytobacillus oceanisediminis]PWW26633.1 hypothetical protein DFO73_110207 [Cytobacillus oceanisediminis]